MNGGPNMTYPYPPPAGAVPIPAKRSHFSKWWPISFLIAAILFFIAGGGLMGGWTASAVDCVDDYYSSYSSYSSCYKTGNNALFYGAIACLALGGICKLVFWILLIVWCVKRSSRAPIVSASYTYQPINNHTAYAGAAAVPQPHPAAPAPMYNAPPYQPSTSPAPYSKEKYCPQCGAASTTPFCPQCGGRM